MYAAFQIHRLVPIDSKSGKFYKQHYFDSRDLDIKSGIPSRGACYCCLGRTGVCWPEPVGPIPDHDFSILSAQNISYFISTPGSGSRWLLPQLSLTLPANRAEKYISRWAEKN